MVAVRRCPCSGSFHDGDSVKVPRLGPEHRSNLQSGSIHADMGPT